MSKNLYTMASKQNKKIMNQQGKTKTIKNKVTGAKTKVKTAVSAKRHLVVKDKKTHPAPITEPGYSLYSTESENTSANTWEQDACFEVLKKLREKKGGDNSVKTMIAEMDISQRSTTPTVQPQQDDRTHIVKPSATIDKNESVKNHNADAVPKALFNERLSSSTPDPEKLSPDKHLFQLIPERDTTHTVNCLPPGGSSAYTNQWMAGHLFSNSTQPPVNDGQMHQMGISQKMKQTQMMHRETSQNVNNLPSGAPVGLSQMIENRAPGSTQVISQPLSGFQTGSNQIHGSSSVSGYFGNPQPFGTRSRATPFQTVTVQSNQTRDQDQQFTQLIQTSSEGFVPSNNNLFESGTVLGNRRESDIAAIQAFIPRDSLGFSPMDIPQIGYEHSSEKANVSSDSRKGLTVSSGEKSVCSQGVLSTPNSSGTDYVRLPTPKGNQGVENVVPAMQKENGLFQIHAHTTESSKVNIESRNKNSMAQTGFGNINLYPHIGANGQSNSNPYLGERFEIPERDTGNGKIPVPSIPNVGEQVPDSVSAISSNKPENLTPSSQRVCSILSPGSNCGNSGSNYTGSDHVTPRDGQEKHQNIQNFQQNSVKPNGGTVSSGLEQQVQNEGGQFSPNSQANFIPTNPVMQPVFLSYTANGAQIIPMRISNEQLGIQGIQLGGYGLSAPSDGIFGSQQQISVQGQSVPLVVSPKSVGVAISSVSAGSEGSKQDIAKAGETGSEQDVHSQQTNPWSKVKTDVKLKRVRYLLKELKECGKISKDVEVQRLTKDIEKTLDKVPQLRSTFSLQAEIDLALQPLRSENSQLRRRLRLINQQLRDQEIETDKIKAVKAVDLDVLHLQGSNAALQKQIAHLREDKVKLATEVTELNSQIQKMKIERNKLLASYSEKETEDFRIKQECLAETQKYRDEIEKHKRIVESSHLKHQAAEQEGHILQITLQQRDIEITRLQEIVQTMKEGMAELLHELEQSKSVDKSWKENNSFGIQKLVRILEEDRPISPSRSITSDPGRASSPHGGKIQPYASNQLQYKIENERPQHNLLTQQALANHNRLHSGRPDVKISTSDTEAEMTILDMKEKRRKRSPRRRRHSYSPRRDSLKVSETYGNALQASSGKYVGPSQTQNVEEIFHMLPKDYRIDVKNQNDTNQDLHPTHRRVLNTDYKLNDTRDCIEGQSEAEIDNQSDEIYYVIPPSQGPGHQRHLVYLDQSRYSVTEYFKKYSQNMPQSVDSSTERRANSKSHRRSLSQPNTDLHSKLDHMENRHQHYSSQQTFENMNVRDTYHVRSNSQDAYRSEQHLKGRKQNFKILPAQTEIQERNMEDSEKMETLRYNKPKNKQFSHNSEFYQVQGRGFDSQSSYENDQGQVQASNNRDNLHRTNNSGKQEMIQRTVGGQNHLQSHNEHRHYNNEVLDDNPEAVFGHMQEQFQNFSQGISDQRSDNETLRKQLHFTNNSSERYEQFENRDQGHGRRIIPQGHRNAPKSYNQRNSSHDLNCFKSNNIPQSQSYRKFSQGSILQSKNFENFPQNYNHGNMPQNQNRRNFLQDQNYGKTPQGYKRNNPSNSARSPQDNLFQGTALDNSISAIIDDDNVSSVSTKTVTSSSTVDDSTFRKGIATLDANILKLQLALQKTKKMLS